MNIFQKSHNFYTKDSLFYGIKENDCPNANYIMKTGFYIPSGNTISDQDIDYVYFLLGLCYYEQIVDEKKDLQSIIKAKETFNIILKDYPNTEYAIDAEFKVDLIDDILAAKEMYLGRYYFDKKKMDTSN